MQLIDKSYFVGERLIYPKDEALDLFIIQREPEFLIHVLGYGFYQELAAAVDASPSIGLAQHWIDLRDGVNYTYHTYPIRWRGLVEVTPKRSPIADYVYYWYRRDQLTQTTSMGEKKTATENSLNADAGQKMVLAWNEMCEWIWDLRAYLNTSGTSVYPNWNSGNWNGRLFRKISMFNL
jgi:hypothetical protein